MSLLVLVKNTNTHSQSSRINWIQRRFQSIISPVKIIMCCALGLTALSQTSRASDNLVINGSFDQLPKGVSWYSLSGVSPNYYAEAAANTVYNVSLSPGSTDNMMSEIENNNVVPTTKNDYLKQTIATTAGEKYYLSVYATCRSNQTDSYFTLEGAGIQSSSFLTTYAAGWNLFNLEFQAPTASTDIRLISDGSSLGTLTYPLPGDSKGTLIDQVNLQDLTQAPSSLTTPEDTSVSTTAFQIATNTSSNTNSILKVTLSVTNGTLQLASTSGLTLTAGANNSSSMTFTGTASNINAAFAAGVTYIPTKDYYGSSTLSYTATAADNTSDTDNVAITVTGTTDITNDNLTMAGNTSLSYNPVAGTNGATPDSFEGSSPTITSVTTPAHGTATYSGNVITYTPNPNYTGTDSFNYTTTSGGTNETATETITINLPHLTITKISNGFTGSFTYSGDNWSGQTITTTTSGTAVTGPTQTLTHADTTTTIVETLNSNFIMSSASCSGLGSGTATVDTATGTITLNSAATAATNNITCSISNTAAAPQLSVTKSTLTSSVSSANSIIIYNIAVKNTGNVTITGITVSDPLGSVTCPSSSNGSIASLAKGQTIVCFTSYTVPQSVMDSNGGGDGKIDNTATVTGTYASQTVSATGSTSVTIVIIKSMGFVKTANTPGPVSVGDKIIYSFKVTNTGNVTIKNVTVDDPPPGTGAWSGAGNETLTTDTPPSGNSTDATANNGVWSVLAPNDTVTFTATYIVSQKDIDNQ